MSEKNRSQDRSIHIFTEKFSEGGWLTFKVLKLMQIPGEEWYYLVQSPQGNRLLMPSRFYHGYQIRIGEPLECRIDKINCSGKIFLEPAHPYFKPGELYSFEAVSREVQCDRKGRSFLRYELSCGFREAVYARFPEGFDIMPPAALKARLIRIRKGVLLLDEPEVINNCS